MKVISIKETETYKEIEVESNYILFKCRSKYRAMKPNYRPILEYEGGGCYKNVGMTTYLNIHAFFDITPDMLDTESLKS